MSSIPSRCTGTGALALTASLVFAALMAAAPASAQVSIAGVHWYSGDTAMLDSTIPVGQRGWNVETIINSDSCASANNNPENARVWAQRAKDAGLVNIIRVDYRNLQAVPTVSNEYTAWSNNFIACINDLAGVASIFVVGNEPNIEGGIGASTYANAFNHLWGRKSQMPAGTQLLAVHNSPFTEPAWTNQMTRLLTNMDGFAFHTGGARAGCQDPRQACSFGGWSFDGAFRYYRNVIDQIDSRFWSKPVYLTEINTFTGSAGSEPAFNYPANWMNLAYEDVRGYNATRGSKPPVVAVCWFVDENRGSWGNWALRSLAAPRTDQGEEFKNPANRSGSPPPTTCPTATLAVPSDRWRLEIWNNRTFTGNPVERRYDAVGAGGFSFNWGSGRASNCTGNDNFAIRFVRTASFATAGTYTFTTTTDDGVRLYIDNVLVLDKWIDQAPTTYSVARSLSAGSHTIRLDYYENGGGASAALSWTGGGGGGGNNANVLEGQSTVPGSWGANSTQQVRVRVQNNGGTTWTSGSLFRLGAAPNNSVNWSSFSCGGYNQGVTNQRVYLCNNVAPGGTHDFVFNVTAPSSGTGALAVRMVQDGVQWFGETQTWSIPVGGGGGNPYPSCPCNRTDNYCQHGPSTSGCPMTFPGGYCDPNGDGSYADGDWVRGWNEYQNYC